MQFWVKFSIIFAHSPNLKIYQICHDLIAYFTSLTSPKKSQLGLIFRTGGSDMELLNNPNKTILSLQRTFEKESIIN